MVMIYPWSQNYFEKKSPKKNTSILENIGIRTIFLGNRKQLVLGVNQVDGNLLSLSGWNFQEVLLLGGQISPIQDGWFSYDRCR